MNMKDILKDIDDAVSGDKDSEILSTFARLLKVKMRLMAIIDKNQFIITTLNNFAEDGPLTDFDKKRRSQAMATADDCTRALDRVQMDINEFLETL